MTPLAVDFDIDVLEIMLVLVSHLALGLGLISLGIGRFAAPAPLIRRLLALTGAILLAVAVFPEEEEGSGLEWVGVQGAVLLLAGGVASGTAGRTPALRWTTNGLFALGVLALGASCLPRPGLPRGILVLVGGGMVAGATALAATTEATPIIRRLLNAGCLLVGLGSLLDFLASGVG